MIYQDQKHSDECFLQRLVRVKAPGDGIDGLVNPYRDVYTLHELVCSLGVYNFIDTFLREKRYYVTDGVEGFWHPHNVQLLLIDQRSGKQIDPVGALRVINRHYALDLYMLRPRKSGSPGRRWRGSKYYRKTTNISILAANQALDDLEPPVRKGYIEKLRDCFEICRSNSRDRSWKRYRDTQYRDARK